MLGAGLFVVAPPALAAEPAAVAPREVTWQDVLRDPDNVELNLSFARAEIGRGRLLSASTVLHRVLLLQPGNLGARVLYAVVLYRLDSFNEARRQLDLLLAQPKLPAALRKELGIYQREVARRLQRTKARLLVSTGLAVDTNPSRIPESETLGGFTPSPADRRGTDIALVNFMRLSVEHDLNLPQRHTLFGSVAYYHSEYKDTPRASHLAFLGEAGARLFFGEWEVTPSARGEWAFLSHEQFLRSLEARLTVGRDIIDRRTRLWAHIAAGPRLFDDLSEAPDQRLRTGTEYRGGLTLRRTIGHTMAVTLGAEAIRESTTASFYRLTAVRLSANHRWRFDNGAFLLSRVSWRLDQYDSRNPVDGPGDDRRDSRLNVGMLLGVPFLTINRRLPAIFNRAAITLNVDYWMTDSNIGRYTNDNWRFVIAITKRFDL